MTDKPKIIFAPGCFDAFDGTQEELDGLIADIKNMAESGTLMDNATKLSDEEEAALLEMLSKKRPRQ
jgi:hypothetical protein